MAAEGQEPAVLRHGAIEVLASLDGDPRQQVLEGPAEERAKLDEHQPEMLPGPPGELAPGLWGQLRECLSKVRERQAPPTTKDEAGEVAEPAPEPVRQPPRRMPEGGGEEGQGAGDRFLRSRAISITIGITESTMTTATTT